MKDGKTILLLIVSLCLVATWGYHIYDKSRYSSDETIAKKDSVNQQTVNDSLQRNYANALLRLGTVQVDKDSINTELNQKVSEIDSLRTEIGIILNVSNITKEDLKKAEDKILVLEQKISQVNKGQKVKTDQVLPNNRNAFADQGPVAPTKNAAVEKENNSGNLSASNTTIKAIASGSNNSTTKADATDYLSVACSLQNNTSSFSDAEIYVVVTAPGGHVIQDDQWQAGMFSTANGMRIPYTRKSTLNYSKGELKRISLTIKPGDIEAGLYSVQVYHNGQRIGKADLRLN